MERTLITLLLLFLVVFIIPILLFFIKTIKKEIRYVLLWIPSLCILFILGYYLREIKSKRELIRQHPELNKLSLKNNPEEVRDSIIVLQSLLKKLPVTSYDLSKYYYSYNDISQGQYRMGSLEYLEQDSILKNLLIEESLKDDWNKYVSKNNYPFQSLSYEECSRFIKLIKYLDKNKITSAYYNAENDRMGSLTYLDSLSRKNSPGFRRSLIIDTTGYSKSIYKEYKIYDENGGIFLIEWIFP